METDIKNLLHRLSIIVSTIILISCTGEDDQNVTVDRSNVPNTITMKSNLVIGLEEQPAEYQFGQPIAVRTDVEGNIYVADRASKYIKVFDQDGNYLRSLGGRGRGPGEFQEMEFMEWTPEGNLVLMDRGNMLYTVISTNGEFVEAFPYNFSNQFYPTQIKYINNNEMVALFLSGSNRSDIPMFKRDLFHIYSTDFQNSVYSFVPFNRLQLRDSHAWVEMMTAPGSFSLSSNYEDLIYSPGIYYGSLYRYIKEDEKWIFNQEINGIKPTVIPHEAYTSTEVFEANRNLPGVSMWYYGSGDPHVGRILSLDLGTFRLNNGKLIHFWGERIENEDFRIDSISEYHYLNIFAQIFNGKGEIEQYGFILSLKEPLHHRSMGSMVNWKDKNDHFYMIEQTVDAVPVIRRFELEIEE